MKTKKYSIQIEDFSTFYEYTRKQHSGILGAEYDKETQELKIFYEDSATQLTKTQLKNMKLPTILKFKKTLPTIKDIPNARFTNENEIVVETFDVKSTHKKVKEKYPDFKEVK